VDAVPQAVQDEDAGEEWSALQEAPGGPDPGLLASPEQVFHPASTIYYSCTYGT
jgi:hypothetical protein